MSTIQRKKKSIIKLFRFTYLKRLSTHEKLKYVIYLSVLKYWKKMSLFGLPTYEYLMSISELFKICLPRPSSPYLIRVP